MNSNIETLNSGALLRVFSLALNIYREASGESFLGKLLVGQVTENRVQDPRWPDTYIGVITQPWQFSSFNRNDPNITRWPKENEPSWEESVMAANLILRMPQPITTANHYHAKSVDPGWSNGRTPEQREGNHLFYTL